MNCHSPDPMRKLTKTQMRERGLCTRCGKPNPTPNNCMCPECKEINKSQRKEVYAYRKRIGICVRCGKNKAEPNRCMCYECLDNDRLRYSMVAKDRRRQGDKNYKRHITMIRLQSGTCPRCGKHESINGGLCKNCRAYLRNYRDMSRQEIPRTERVSYGLCYICGNKVMDGKGVCEECYKTRLSSVTIMNSYPKDNEYFKRLNTYRIQEIRHLSEK